ncbi:hypothetical protein BN12_2860003 [Nostocoides japonicum T1-X7]|uniref:Uncharacterized protein n=1 Tax=Nostocoides japonicum T1-X7 TaxID=1194083 RepID=A0A077M2D7_9MICO|nr:hypothetical protein BN12_2860003 [Tetrasphaera japonica T1-X7]
MNPSQARAQASRALFEPRELRDQLAERLAHTARKGYAPSPALQVAVLRGRRADRRDVLARARLLATAGPARRPGACEPRHVTSSWPEGIPASATRVAAGVRTPTIWASVVGSPDKAWAGRAGATPPTLRTRDMPILGTRDMPILRTRARL